MNARTAAHIANLPDPSAQTPRYSHAEGNRLQALRSARELAQMEAGDVVRVDPWNLAASA